MTTGIETIGITEARRGVDEEGATNRPSTISIANIPSSTAFLSPSTTTPHLFLDLGLPTSTTARAYLTAQLQHIFDRLILGRIRTLRKWTIVCVFGVLNASPLPGLELSADDLEREGWDLERYVDGLGLDLNSNSNSVVISKDYYNYVVLEFMVFLQRIILDLYTSCQAHIPYLAPVFSLGNLSTDALAASSVASMVVNVTGYSVLGGIGNALDKFIPSESPYPSSLPPPPSPPPSPPSPPLLFMPSPSQSSETSTLLGSPQISRSSTNDTTPSTSTLTRRPHMYSYGAMSSEGTFVNSDDTADGADMRLGEDADGEVKEEVKEEEVAAWCLRDVLLMAIVLPPIISLWLSPNALLGSLRSRGEQQNENEMEQVIQLASTYLRVAAMGLPAFGVNEVVKRYLRAKGYSWIHPSVLTMINPLVVGLNYLLVDGPIPTLKLGFIAAPAITAFTYNAIAVGMCLLFLSQCGFVSTGTGMKRSMTQEVEEGQPLLTGKKGTNSTPINYTKKGPEVGRIHQRNRNLARGMFALLKESIKGICANAAQFWSKDLVAFVACLMGPSTLAAQSILLATVSTAYLIPSSVRGVYQARIKKHIDNEDIRRARVVALIGFAFTVLGVFFASAVVVFSSDIAQLVSPDEAVIRIATRAFPTIALYIVAQGAGAWIDGGLDAFGYPILFSSFVASADYCIGLPLGVYLIFFDPNTRNGAGGWGIEAIWAGLALSQTVGCVAGVVVLLRCLLRG